MIQFSSPCPKHKFGLALRIFETFVVDNEGGPRDFQNLSTDSHSKHLCSFLHNTYHSFCLTSIWKNRENTFLEM